MLYFALDGRPEELGRNYFVALMPVVSANYGKFLSWNGTGRINASEEKKLKEFIAKAHQEGKRVRLWGGPDTKTAWSYLLSRGVDLINTDKLVELALFLKSQQK